MSVIYIGDRETGKTHLAMELANPNYQRVQIISPDYQGLKALLYDENLGRTKGTSDQNAVYDEYLHIKAELPTGQKEITLNWLDTPGEIWRKSWQEKNPDQWNLFLDNLKTTEGILLILPPYREIINKQLANPDDFITRQQWCNRFQRWSQFFKRDCPKIKHLIFCLNKADLFCSNLSQEAKKLAYIPNNNCMTWQQRDSYITGRYFNFIQPEIIKLNQSIRGLSVRCFITSIYQRELLELPWLYLATYLAKG